MLMQLHVSTQGLQMSLRRSLSPFGDKYTFIGGKKLFPTMPVRVKIEFLLEETYRETTSAQFYFSSSFDRRFKSFTMSARSR